MKQITGACNISAKIIADSISKYGTRMTTMELEYPRFIHSELMTHRMLSKNAASSRAIPIAKMIDIVREKTAMPVYWGLNQAGMKAKEEASEEIIDNAKTTWNRAMEHACRSSEIMAELGLHKQIPNRLTEPFQMMKTVISGTEWANLLWLRNHEDAQPEFKELAQCIETALTENVPRRLNAGEWHLPYVMSARDDSGKLRYYLTDEIELSLYHARMVSASCCAQVSYRKTDDSLEKAVQIFDRLINSQPMHASPVEHQATPMEDQENKFEWQEGMTHVDRNGNRWSGNLKEWIQFRKMIKDEARW